MTDWPTTKLRWLGSVRGPLFLPELRHIPPPNTPLMITSQHPPRIVIQTLKRSWNGRGAWRRQVPPLGLRLVRGLVPGQLVRGDAPPVGDLEALSAGPRPDVGLVMPGRARASCCPPG